MFSISKEGLNMNSIINKMYLHAPFFVKEMLANVEALRRNRYRKYGDYEKVKSSLDFINYMNTYEKSEDYETLSNLKTLLNFSINYVPFYANYPKPKLHTLSELQMFPLLTKNHIRNNKTDMLPTIVKKEDLWNGTSSGSTGTPLSYYRDKNSVRTNQALYDSYYKSLGCDIEDKRIRFSGIKLTTFDRKKPPYWIYISKFKQLQCSVYHLSEDTCKYYIEKFVKYKSEFGTGYPSAWGYLAKYIIKHNIQLPPMKAIITDSEAMDDSLQNVIEKAFKCKVYHTYGLSEVGMLGMQCGYRNYHTVPKLNIIETVNSKGESVINEEGQIIVTDLNSKGFPFIRYKTGDRGIIKYDKCACGYSTPYIKEITGRVEDYILTKDGRKIQRVSQIIKPAIGVKESQIIQKTRNSILIKIVADENFEEKSMEKVIESAHLYIGDMKVTWEVVSKLELMPSGKLKFLIREFEE